MLPLLAALMACSGTCSETTQRPTSKPAAEMELSNISTTPQPKPKPARPAIIDAHTHLGHRAYAIALKLADENGIARMVNLSGGFQGRGMKYHVAALEKYKGRLAVFYNLSWNHVNAEDFGPVSAAGLEEAVKAGYAGLKIPKVLGLGVTNPDGTYIAVDDPRFDPIWAKAGELGVPVSIHTSDPKAFFEPVTPDNERYEELSEAPSWSFADPKYPRRDELLAQRDRMVARHPKTTFILVHFANNPEDIDYVDRLLDTYPNAYVDLSARLAEIGRHDPDKVRALFIKHQKRILFGSDIGVRTRRHEGEYYLSLFLGSISKEPPTLADAHVFFDRHWDFFERDHREAGDLPHPVPIQGNWTIKPIALSGDVLQAIYHDNAYRLIFAPMYKRLGIADPGVQPMPPSDENAPSPSDSNATPSLPPSDHP